MTVSDDYAPVSLSATVGKHALVGKIKRTTTTVQSFTADVRITAADANSVYDIVDAPITATKTVVDPAVPAKIATVSGLPAGVTATIAADGLSVTYTVA